MDRYEKIKFESKVQEKVLIYETNGIAALLYCWWRSPALLHGVGSGLRSEVLGSRRN